MIKAVLLGLMVVMMSLQAKAQGHNLNDSAKAIQGNPKELDLVDLFRSIGKDSIVYRQKGDPPRAQRENFSVVPAAGYSLQTSFAALLAANSSFHVGQNSNVSLISTNITYTA